MVEDYNLLLSAIRGKINPKEGNSYFEEYANKINFNHINNIILTGSGASWNACLIGKYMLEGYTQIPTHTIHNSKLCSHANPFDKNTLLIIVGDMGEYHECREFKEKLEPNNISIIHITNRFSKHVESYININIETESEIINEDQVIPHLITLSLITLNIARHKTISLIEGREIIASLYALPEKINQISEQAIAIRSISNCLKLTKNIGILGNRYNFGIAKESVSIFAKKCKIHSCAIYGSEMKHGPITLVEEGMPFIVILCEDKLFAKTLSNIEELKSRKAKIYLITNFYDKTLSSFVDQSIVLPQGAEILTPILSLTAIRLIANYTAEAIYDI